MKKMMIAISVSILLSSCSSSNPFGDTANKAMAEVFLPDYIEYRSSTDIMKGESNLALNPQKIPTRKNKQKWRNKLIKEGKCPDCKGIGQIKGTTCKACDGSGKFVN